jgi:G:T-mismatch repair DNA endonuclease (very short patch repair protein)
MEKQTIEEKSKNMSEIKKKYFLEHPEKKLQISSKLKGRTLSEEHKRKIGEANKITARKAWADGKFDNTNIKEKLSNYNRERKEKLGYVNSPETREKIRQIQKRRWANGEITDAQKEIFFKQRGVRKGMKNSDYQKQQAGKALKETRKTQVFPLKDTQIEIKIQNFLKELGIEFLTHQYMHIEHGYQCDILIPSIKTVIECFGNYWHKYPNGTEKDKLRCIELRKEGFRVLVFWENEIKLMELNHLKNKLEVT